MTRSEIETQVLNTINRNGDAIAAAQVSFGFQVAHRDIQRKTNALTATEITGYVTLVVGANSYSVFSDFKEPILAYLWDPTDSKVLAFYNKVNITTLRDRRFKVDPVIDPNVDSQSYDTYLYAIHADKFELWPDVDSTLVESGNKFGVDYYRYITVPETDSSDWFTVNAIDYLVYRTLRECVSFFGLSDAHAKRWESQEERALRDIIGIDISKQNSGPLRIRG